MQHTIPENVFNEVYSNIARKLTPQPVKIRADVEVTCFGYEGIDAVKRALKAGESVKQEGIPITVKLVAPPLYVVITNTTDKTGGLELLEESLKKIAESIAASGGQMNIKMKVCVGDFYPSIAMLTFVRSQKLSPRLKIRSWPSSWPVSRRKTQRSRETKTRRTKSKDGQKECLVLLLCYTCATSRVCRNEKHGHQVA